MFEAYFKSGANSAIEDKEAMSRAIAQEIKAFKKVGGKIQYLPYGIVKSTKGEKVDFNTGIISSRKKNK